MISVLIRHGWYSHTVHLEVASMNELATLVSTLRTGATVALFLGPEMVGHMVVDVKTRAAASKLARANYERWLHRSDEAAQ